MSTPTKEALANLCEALGNTYWSSWQTTGKFWSQLEAANAVIASERIRDAAPELLEACLAMIEWDDRENDHAVDFHKRMELCELAFQKARAAIAKATGENT